MQSLPPELTFQFLAKLPYRDIKNYCATNTQTRAICYDQHFWLYKLDYDFTKIIHGIEFKPSVYARLYARDIGEHMYLRWYEAVSMGYTNILKTRTNDIYSYRLKYDFISKKDIIMWLLDSGQYYKYDNMKYANMKYATPDTQIDLGIYYMGIAFNDLDILQWLEKQKFVFGGIPFESNINTLPIYQWLSKRGVGPKEYIANSAAEAGNLDLLNYLGKFKPGRNGANAGARASKLQVLEWLEKYKILPTRNFTRTIDDTDGTYRFSMSVPVLQWLEKHKIPPTIQDVENAIIQNNIPTIYWLHSKGLVPEVTMADKFLQEQNLEALQMFGQHNVYPSTRVVDEYECVLSDEILQWLLEQKFPFTKNDANTFLRLGIISKVELLAQYGIFPDPTVTTYPHCSRTTPQSNLSPILSQVVPTTVSQVIPTPVSTMPPQFTPSTITRVIPNPVSTIPQQFTPQFTPQFTQVIPNPVSTMPPQFTPSTITRVIPNPVSTIPPQFTPSTISQVIQPKPVSIRASEVRALPQGITTIPKPQIPQLNNASHGVEEIVKPGDDTTVLNPETKRWVKKNGKVYNSLVVRGIIIPRS